MRILKLAKTWKTMKKILSIMGNSVAALSYLSLILFIVIYALALVGLNLFSSSYSQHYSTEEMPRLVKLLNRNIFISWLYCSKFRTNFLNILNSLLLIFRIICGDCFQPLTECWIAAGPSCIAIFYVTVLFGNFLVK
jgi:hypothetical protein